MVEEFTPWSVVRPGGEAGSLAPLPWLCLTLLPVVGCRTRWAFPSACLLYMQTAALQLSGQAGREGVRWVVGACWSSGVLDTQKLPCGGKQQEVGGAPAIQGCKWAQSSRRRVMAREGEEDGAEGDAKGWGGKAGWMWLVVMAERLWAEPVGVGEEARECIWARGLR